MTKTMKNKMTPTRRTGGFTLIEMLVVAALIAIFAGLAVFNVVEQLNREKEKAGLAEARSIATAMSFAYDDLGFFPRLCFLRYGADEMAKTVTDLGLPNDSIEYFGYADPTMANRIKNNWSDKYMAGSMPDKYATMQIGTSAGTKDMPWPIDPFKQPYVGYFVKIETPAGGGAQQISFLQKVGEKANYFAGIVSYGRNKVPGLTWDEIDAADLNPREALRLYVPTTDPRVFQMPRPTAGIPNAGFYSQAKLDLLVLSNTTNNPALPNIRDAGSDDKFFEF